MKNVDEQQLLKRQTSATARAFRDRLRPMHHPYGVAEIRHTGKSQHVFRQVFRDERQQRIQMRIDDSAYDLEGEPFSRGINGENAPAGDAVVILAEVDVL